MCRLPFHQRGSWAVSRRAAEATDHGLDSQRRDPPPREGGSGNLWVFIALERPKSVPGFNPNNLESCGATLKACAIGRIDLIHRSAG